MGNDFTLYSCYGVWCELYSENDTSKKSISRLYSGHWGRPHKEKINFPKK